MGGHKAKNWGCPDTVDTNGSSPRGACNRQAAGQRTLAPFCSAYDLPITRIEAIRLKRSVTITKTADDINITHSGNKHAQLTQLLNRSNLLQRVINGVNRKRCQRCNKFTANRLVVKSSQSESKSKSGIQCPNQCFW